MRSIVNDNAHRRERIAELIETLDIPHIEALKNKTV